jgi:hypothetical protein
LDGVAAEFPGGDDEAADFRDYVFGSDVVRGSSIYEVLAGIGTLRREAISPPTIPPTIFSPWEMR